MKKISVILLLILLSSQAKAQCSDNVRAALGGTSAVLVYNEFLLIGFLSDAYFNGLYEKEYTLNLINAQIDMIGLVQEQLDDATLESKNGITKDDIAYVEKLNDVLDYLVLEASALKNEITAGTIEAQNAYTENRDKAWAMIAELMGVE